MWLAKYLTELQNPCIDMLAWAHCYTDLPVTSGWLELWAHPCLSICCAGRQNTYWQIASRIRLLHGVKYNFTQANDAVLAGSCRGSPTTKPHAHTQSSLIFLKEEKTLWTQCLQFFMSKSQHCRNEAHKDCLKTALLFKGVQSVQNKITICCLKKICSKTLALPYLLFQQLEFSFIGCERISVFHYLIAQNPALRGSDPH